MILILVPVEFSFSYLTLLAWFQEVVVVEVVAAAAAALLYILLS